MPEQITPYIEQFYDDAEIWLIINEATYFQQQFQEPDILNNTVCVVLPIVRRLPGYVLHQFDLELFIKHPESTDLGQLELYRVRDFIRQKVDLGPLMQGVQQITGVNIHQVLKKIKQQIKFLQQVENQDLPIVPAQMISPYNSPL
ncbi:hypothetical protein AHMF7605_11395 [Adhaeribacter arboris]|uniref:Uncharacterized protein n=1 Tax=Adhaeribacter arboris TaxID=2072846 RepID=A0A2T2YF01_9BACT|nr:hypothetical protein [Adhaeribacter arboris]PSR54082.1 hypothetical protein AHMF7605_11395 [Adhaeribacter arboris]